MSLIHKAGKIRPEPTPHRQQIKDLNFTVGAVAQYINRTYVHTLNLLNGAENMKPEIQAKIEERIELVENDKI